MKKTALITGGAKRIGRALCLELAKKGYDIALHYNVSTEDAEKTREEIIALGVECNIFRTDLSNIDETTNLIPDVIDKMEGLSMLINNASVFEDVSFFDVTPEYFDFDHNVNFKSPFFLSQDFAKNVEEGHIINFLDTRVNRTATQHFVYNISKKSLLNLTRMTAKILAPKIRVNGICPGPILPPPGESKDYLENIVKLAPLKMTGNIEVILKAVNYLMDNNFITGECLFVDGGKHLNY